MSQYTHQDRTLAICGIYQAAKMVMDFAAEGKTDESAYLSSLNSLFIDNPSSTIDVYGGDAIHIQKGVETLLNQMSSDPQMQNRNMEITRYALSLMVLAKKLLQNPEILNRISSALETAKSQNEHFGHLHENAIATIAKAYSDNVSTLSPRIMVNGHQTHLQNAKIANKIRAVLLSGIRSAILWYQVGGTRWDLIWSRKKYLKAAQALYRPQNDSNTPTLQ